MEKLFYFGERSPAEDGAGDADQLDFLSLIVQ